MGGSIVESLWGIMANAGTIAPPLLTNQGASLTQRTRIRGFDGLRAIAFLLVFVSHKVYFAHADSFGDVGVWLFFVLSGFLITRILAHSRAEIEDGAASVANSLGRFYLRRTARIFPPYYLLLLSLVVVSLFVPIDYFKGPEKLAYFLYGTNILVGVRNAWIGDFGHLWTLAVEEQFYLAFAPLVLLAPRRHTFGVCLAMISMGIATKVVLETRHAPPISIDVNSLANFALLGFGGAVGLLADRRAPKWLAAGAAQVAVLSAYVALPMAFGTWPYLWPLLGKLSAVLVGLLLLQIFQGQQSWFVSILNSAPLQGLGRISYGAYLIHKFVHFTMIENFVPSFAVAPRPVQVLAELAASLIIAGLSWRYFEQPIIRWAARVTSHRTSAAPSSRSASPVQVL
jgi:peptidoglycan/LPS O-acetylase OafA/YrhL